MSKYTKIILIVSLLWGSLATTVLINLNKPPISVDLLSNKKGLVRSALCVDSRSSQGIRFEVGYSGNDYVEDFIFLPNGLDCNSDLLDKFIGQIISISYYENYYLGIEIGDLIIRDELVEVRRVNNSRIDFSFEIFVILIISLSVLFYYRNRL